MSLNYMDEFEPPCWIFWAFAPPRQGAHPVYKHIYQFMQAVWSVDLSRTHKVMSRSVLMYCGFLYSHQVSLKEKYLLVLFQIDFDSGIFRFSRSCYFLPGLKELDWADLGMYRMRAVCSLLPLVHCFSFWTVWYHTLKIADPVHRENSLNP